MRALDRRELLIGGMTDDDTARRASLDIRYIYLAGGLPDGDGPCARCSIGCTARRQSCASSSPRACGWWGCWQWDRAPPGKYLRDFLEEAAVGGHLPMVTYYELLHASGVPEGVAEIDALADRALMSRYFADWRFVLQTVGQRRALLHLEPDLWGYAQHRGPDPDQLPASVSSANEVDCVDLPDRVSAVGRCLVRMARKYAPHAKVGLHASFWATKVDVSVNRDRELDVVGAARKVGGYLRKLGAAEADFVVIGASDRDAAWYETRGQNRWWDETNASLPNFHQAFLWARTVSETVQLPHLWWQLPLGNRKLPNTEGRWQDNRVDYFFAHPEEVVAANGFGMVFGPGKPGMTSPATDSGNFVRHTVRYRSSGGPHVCQ
jgi:hypothetical protein